MSTVTFHVKIMSLIFRLSKRIMNISPNSNQRSVENIASTSNLPGEKMVHSKYYHIQPNKAGHDTIIENVLVYLSFILVMVLFPFSMFTIFVVVRQFERVVILRNGKVRKNRVYGPGLVFYLPCVDVIKYTDMRIISYAVPPQEALTKDSLTVTVDAVVFYKICDPVWAVINIDDYNKDISLPLQLQKAMAAEAESSRLANAKIIVARAEIESTKSLQTATTMLMDNPLCMQLRYLQSLHMIAGDNTHTIVFPWSVNTLKKILK